MIQRDSALDADGLLVRPISGQIYLIEEEDSAAPPRHGTQFRFPALISRH
jgi:hypothetical protein